MTDTSTCDKALRAFAAKDFVNWHGLPAACMDNDLQRIFSAQDDWVGTGRLGLDAITAKYRFWHVNGYSSPVRTWLVKSRLVEIDVETLADELRVAVLASVLGAPTAKLDAYFGVPLIEQSEWVYPERGIIFNTDSSGTFIARLGVFVPATLEVYRHKLRMNLQQKPVPASKRK
jgi:hypothetical protein